MEEIAASTDLTNKLPSASAVNELNSSLEEHVKRIVVLNGVNGVAGVSFGSEFAYPSGFNKYNTICLDALLVFPTGCISAHDAFMVHFEEDRIIINPKNAEYNEVQCKIVIFRIN